jgi:2-amino-4-hydroxy-6-hydroxymethyldihydropteridine diphosphokinase
MQKQNKNYNICFLSLGSNLGKREEILQSAIIDLQNLGEVKNTSSFFYNQAEGGIATHEFVNLCLELHTRLSALQLLTECQKIENKYLRTREIHWGNRTLDIDIISFNNDEIYTDNLNVPHPFACKREFVLKPLAEIANFECKNGKLIINSPPFRGS